MKKEIEQKTRKTRGTYVLCILLSVFFAANLLNAQNTPQGSVTVQGSIVDEQGEPVIGATILAESTTIGTISDIDGNFRLTVPSGVENLTISFLGYVTQHIRVTPGKKIDIVLIVDQKMLSEVVVVGYGTQKKETVTGSIETVSMKELVQAPVANISNALVGRAPGLTAMQSSGEPGDNASTLRIRGMATLNWDGMEPLIVIDGVQGNFGILNTMDPHEIDNISVLKDASATAVYGVRGANGVIIVTTRRGREGKPQFSFSSNIGVSTLSTRLKMLGSYEYAMFRNEAILNDRDVSQNRLLFTDDELWKFRNNRDYTPDEVNNMPGLTDQQRQALLNSPALYYTNNDYFADQFGDHGTQQQYNFNVSGGSEKSKYFASLGYFSQEGVFKPSGYGGSNLNSEFRRWNMRSNFDLDVVPNLKINIGIAGQFANKQGIMGNEQDGDVVGSYARHKAMLVAILGSPPFAGPGFVDGKLVSGFIGAGTNPLEAKGGWGFSPITSLFGLGIMQNQTTNLSSDIRLRHTMDYITPGLSTGGTVSYYDTYTTGKQIWRTIPLRSPLSEVRYGRSLLPTT